MTMQQEIIKELGVLPTIDPKEEVRKSIDFFKGVSAKESVLAYVCLGDQWWTRFDVSWTACAIDDGGNAQRNWES